MLAITDRTFPEGQMPPYSYSRQKFDELASLELHADRRTRVESNPIAVLHPVSYLPQSLTIAVGQATGLRPLALFYLARFAGLIAGVLLTFLAIRIMPFHKWALAGVALLPPITFSRSTLDADQFTIGLAFLFAATAFREIGASGPMRARSIAAVAALAFVMAQAKSAYLLLPLLVCAIPRERFSGRIRKSGFVALTTLPGVAASLGWMLSLRLSYFDGIRYKTWSGIVRPDDQMASILADPLGFASVLLKTVSTTPLIPQAIIDLLGVFGPPVMLPLFYLPVLALVLAALVISQERTGYAPDATLKATASIIVAATVALIMTLLYLQWTRFGAPVVHGFNGRYIYPLVPLLLVLIPPGGQRMAMSPRGWLVTLASIAGVATALKTWATYWA